MPLPPTKSATRPQSRTIPHPRCLLPRDPASTPHAAQHSRPGAHGRAGIPFSTLPSGRPRSRRLPSPSPPSRFRLCLSPFPVSPLSVSPPLCRARACPFCLPTHHHARRRLCRLLFFPPVDRRRMPFPEPAPARRPDASPPARTAADHHPRDAEPVQDERKVRRKRDEGLGAKPRKDPGVAAARGREGWREFGERGRDAARPRPLPSHLASRPPPVRRSRRVPRARCGRRSAAPVRERETAGRKETGERCRGGPPPAPSIQPCLHPPPLPAAAQCAHTTFDDFLRVVLAFSRRAGRPSRRGCIFPGFFFLEASSRPFPRDPLGHRDKSRRPRRTPVAARARPARPRSPEIAPSGRRSRPFARSPIAAPAADAPANRRIGTSARRSVAARPKRPGRGRGRAPTRSPLSPARLARRSVRARPLFASKPPGRRPKTARPARTAHPHRASPAPVAPTPRQTRRGRDARTHPGT